MEGLTRGFNGIPQAKEEEVEEQEEKNEVVLYGVKVGGSGSICGIPQVTQWWLKGFSLVKKKLKYSYCLKSIDAKTFSIN